MKTAPILLVQCLCAGILLSAQDADTIVLKNDGKKFTLISQIEDPKEAAAFLAILSDKNPRARFELAGTFVKIYSQSWLLPQAYDLWCRSAIDLGNYEEALDYGRFSLRLLPENPSLLILVANLEAQRNETASAINDADDALIYLKDIERPPNMSQREWNAIRPQLKSSAYFARARAEASRGLTTRNPATLVSAMNDLNRAAAWNSVDTEVFYLRAIVETRLGQKSAAGSDLAFVFGNDPALREKARDLLSILWRQNPPAGTSFETFIKSFPVRSIDSNLRNESQREVNPQAVAFGYAGPEACRPCHEKEYLAWRKTGMARMLQPYRPENVFGDFSKSTLYSEAAEKGREPDVIRMGVAGRPYFELLNSGSWNRYYVDFTIGSKWQQAYATKLPDGRLQVLPIEYNLLQNKWINYWKMIDPPGSARADIQSFPKLTAATNYQQNCAICHTSELKADVSLANPMEHASFLQAGIACEMCHGPSAWHVKEMKKSALEHRDPLEPPLDFGKLNNRDGVRVCAQCHRQSAVREIGEGGEMNYSKKGNFVPATWLRPYDAFSRKAFYKDGRFRETTFIVEAFTRSACYRRGGAQCATCHSPHLDSFESNKTSLKFQRNPNEMCLGCHSEYRNRVAEHSRHLKNSEASQCVSCHMPRIANALLFKARSHQIERPSADLTERFGQEDSPNVCLTCHAEKDTAWAKEQLSDWLH